MHHRNIDALVIETYKFASAISLDVIYEIFRLGEIHHHSQRCPSKFIVPPVLSIYNEAESATYIGPKMQGKIFQK